MTMISRKSLLATATVLALMSAPVAFAGSEKDKNASHAHTSAATQSATAQTATDAQAAVDPGTGARNDAQAGTHVQADPVADAVSNPADSGIQSSGVAASAQAGADVSENASATGQVNAATAGQASWADIDTDKDGNISRTEAAAMPALDRVFVAADGDADGSLTADEYRTYAETSAVGQGQTGTEAGGTEMGTDATMGTDASTGTDATDTTPDPTETTTETGDDN